MGTLMAGATVGITALSSPLFASAPSPVFEDADTWFKKVKGKHKVVYDAPEPHDGFSVIWSWVFYKTNNETATPDSDMTAVVVLRHNAIPFAMDSKLWDKYKFGEAFGVKDPATDQPAVQNPYWIPDNPMWKTLGVDGIKRMQERGAMFCVCDMALTVYSMMTAQKTGGTPEEIKKEWVAGLLPGIQVVPSGVWALGRAQEKGCGYIFAG